MAGLHIDLLAVGRLKEDYWAAACAEYARRLGRYARIRVCEVPDTGARSSHDVGRALREEAAQLRRRLPAGACTAMLDSGGAQLSSEGLAAFVAERQGEAHGGLCFVIGGSWGIDEGLKREADLLLSLGPLTLPHNLARVVLLEQLYRAFKIINGEPYHK
ncbi:MAG: 23S rRNA (pseudouridine(1915)-N(3))-methyltransferase RlmH [Coriobacteriales bacterium]|jgi:23S rRNA (pseudouridine1915-N3)-methyltransferase|nr:23S rRNA (pseudouridine(1915)-N(3))-methyltransferase RlmH [Coriobacteriales bacterium]